MNLKDCTRARLLEYLTRQIEHLFPDGRAGINEVLERDIDEALDRLSTCINAVRMWRADEFSYLHSEQNTIFLYYLANTIWRNRQDEHVCTKLFYLNKALNGFSCFYDTELPEHLFIGHSVGIVLVRNAYPDYFAIYQNCTVGKNHGAAPRLERGLLMYPGATIIGDCHVRAGTIVAQGASIINADTPGDCYVFSNGGALSFKTPKRDALADIFRM
jgi:serine O-acetyltransferase